ncbi:MAG TPA: hypothetical protein VFQ44_22560 [Streptosporangiaceae bacterium]|nr:hypothetical protein [Streptosporangiaceae bacterium]
MQRRHKRLYGAAAIAGTLLGGLTAGPVIAAFAAPAWSTFVCHGTFHKPGHLTGRHWSVIVRGTCVVDRGPALVQGNILIRKHSNLIAAFGRHHSRLIVKRNIFVERGATLILGCEAKHSPCLDDPHPKKPSRNSRSIVFGSIFGNRALGIVVHNSVIGRNVIQAGGGGGTTCRPHGVFRHLKSPVFSDYEDSFVHGTLVVRKLRSCWLGVIRNLVVGSVVVSRNRMADHDANEVVTNVVLRNLVCFRNHPRVQFGDSHGKPNKVSRHALFECSFRRLVPSPAGQHKHFEHISVRLRRHHHR